MTSTNDLDWSPEALKSALGAFMKGQGLKGREFFHPLRLFLTNADSAADRGAGGT